MIDTAAAPVAKTNTSPIAVCRTRLSMGPPATRRRHLYTVREGRVTHLPYGYPEDCSKGQRAERGAGLGVPRLVDLVQQSGPHSFGLAPSAARRAPPHRGTGGGRRRGRL